MYPSPREIENNCRIRINETRTTQNTFFEKERNVGGPGASEVHFLPWAIDGWKRIWRRLEKRLGRGRGGRMVLLVGMW